MRRSILLNLTGAILLTGTLISQARAADVEKGRRLFMMKCGMCHTVDANGPKKMGPNLHGLVGRKAGSLAGYNYSSAMSSSAIVWSAATLDSYLENPHRDVPNDKMPFAGLPNKSDRDDLIAYLEQATR